MIPRLKSIEKTQGRPRVRAQKEPLIRRFAPPSPQGRRISTACLLTVNFYAIELATGDFAVYQTDAVLKGAVLKLDVVNIRACRTDSFERYRLQRAAWFDQRLELGQLLACGCCQLGSHQI